MEATNRYYLGIAICEEILCEAEVPKDPTLSKMVKNPKVMKLIGMSKKLIRGGKLSTFERQEMKTLLDDPKVKAYLQASEKVGQRIGWIQGSLAGGLSGALIAAIKAGSAGMTLIPGLALVVLGAIAGGISLGFIASKIKGILRRWKTEEELTKGGLSSGTLVQM